MEIITIEDVKVILHLEPEETRWLHKTMQNPFFCTPENESPTDKEMRKLFFEATDIDTPIDFYKTQALPKKR